MTRWVRQRWVDIFAAAFLVAAVVWGVWALMASATCDSACNKAYRQEGRLEISFSGPHCMCTTDQSLDWADKTLERP